MEQITDFQGLKGKVISDVKQSGSDLYLRFTDGSFAVMTLEHLSEGFNTREIVSIDDYKKDKTEETLVELGIITKAEYEEACKEELIRYEERCSDREAKDLKRQEDAEREMLQKLQTKYRIN